MSNEYSGGVGCGTVLLIIFVVLKLTDLIDWSWWWVLSPLWIPLGLVAAFVALIVCALGVVRLVQMRRGN